MENIENYLRILTENLQKKLEVLGQVEVLNEQQAVLCSAVSMDFEAFDGLVEEKGRLIDRINSLDEGFDQVFDRIREELLSHKDLYKKQIAAMQELIKQVTDTSVVIQASEERNRNQVTAMFRRERDKMKQGRAASDVALRYHQSMSKVNYIDPQLMDKKVGGK